jgi:hypothetical protein
MKTLNNDQLFELNRLVSNEIEATRAEQAYFNDEGNAIAAQECEGNIAELMAIQSILNG